MSTASELFDAAIYPAREQQLAEAGLEVVARPGMAAPMEVTAGTLALRRGRAEGRLGKACSRKCTTAAAAVAARFGSPVPKA
ncbi:MAG: hypothetical protein DMF78_04000 [Acidobacteria bacterium]|nr:MAG: hypothetical protein DMF78_04000 [Acidobacteriota bacterium]